MQWNPERRCALRIVVTAGRGISEQSLENIQMANEQNNPQRNQQHQSNPQQGGQSKPGQQQQGGQKPGQTAARSAGSSSPARQQGGQGGQDKPVSKAAA